MRDGHIYLESLELKKENQSTRPDDIVHRLRRLVPPALSDKVNTGISVLMDDLRQVRSLLKKGSLSPDNTVDPRLNGACEYRRIVEAGEVTIEVGCIGCDGPATPADPRCRHGLKGVLLNNDDASKMSLARGVCRYYDKAEVEILREEFSSSEPTSSLPQPCLQVPFSSTRLNESPPPGSVLSQAYVVGDGLLPMDVSIYHSPNRAQRMYWAMPAEYRLIAPEVALLLHARRNLAKNPPEELLLAGEPANHGRLIHALLKNMESSPLCDGVPENRRVALAGVMAKHTSGFGIIEGILTDPRIEDVFINTPAQRSRVQVVWREEEMETNMTLSTADVEGIVSRFRALSGRAFSQASPVMDLSIRRLNVRVAVIGRPLASGVAYAFHRHSTDPWTLPRLVKAGMLSPVAAGLLSVLINGQCSILVTGSRGAGKTSLLGAMLMEVPQRFRILTIEDTPEIHVDMMQQLGWNLQSMLVRSAVGGSSSEFEAHEALRTALRLGESVLVIGEVRGEEARVLYEAMRVGAAGNSVLGTIHGSSTLDVYRRVVHDLGISPSSFSATDAVVVCSSIRHGGGLSRSRRVTQVSEVITEGMENVEPVFKDIIKCGSNNGDEIEKLECSRLLCDIARMYGMDLDSVLKSVDNRAEVMQVLASGPPRLRDARGYTASQNAWWISGERARTRDDALENQLERWREWFDRETSRG